MTRILTPTRRPAHRALPARVAAALGALALGSSLMLGAGVAAAQGMGAGPGMQGGPGMHHTMPGGPGQGMQGRGPGGMNAEAMQQHMAQQMERRIGYMVWNAGGTTEQRDRIVAIHKAAHADLKSLHEARMNGRKNLMELLAAPTLDKAAIEAARSAQMQAADAASKRMTQAMTDAAEVLTPEQRAKVAEQMKRRAAGGPEIGRAHD